MQNGTERKNWLTISHLNSSEAERNREEEQVVYICSLQNEQHETEQKKTETDWLTVSNWTALKQRKEPVDRSQN